jgi:hypothetical protein|tara:strand:+ start:368 stop:1180 length:813 start_codon:yes stop_codon:yes gene_type:complete
MKHNKKRNTAFIYEVLTKELTKAIVNNDADKKTDIITILKEHFIHGAPLAEELNLYNILLNTRHMQPKLAERLLVETKTAHSLLSESAIFDAQSKLIAAINKGLGQDVWSNFVPNFKTLASVDSIFSPKTAVKKRVLFEQATIDTMSTAPNSDAPETMVPIDTLTYGSFIKKYNEKYGDLHQEQKELLNRFITSFADDGFELRLYLNEELSRLKGLLSKAAEADLKPLVSQKTAQVTTYLNEFKKRDFSDPDLKKILKTQELIRELEHND